MADVAVELLLRNLRQLLLYNAHLITDVRNQMEELEKELRRFKAFLRCCPMNRRKEGRVEVLVRKIQDIVYDAEDLIDTFIDAVVLSKSGDLLRSVGKTLNGLLFEVRDIDVGEGDPSEYERIMAAVGVEHLLEKLKQLLLVEASGIVNVKNEVEILENSLRVFNAFLDYRLVNHDEDEKTSLNDLERQIRKVVGDAEGMIGALADAKAKTYFKSIDAMRGLHRIAKEAESIAERALATRTLLPSQAPFRTAMGKKGSQPIKLRQECAIGFEDEAKILIGYLSEKSEQLDIISIIGMPGLGKTTLAGKIFNDPAIQDEFSTRIWARVSREFTEKNVFLAILSKFTRVTDDMRNKTGQELAKMVLGYLEMGKFLIVMDDVCTEGDWDKLQIALPKSNKMGKVLITSRHLKVGQHANRHRAPHCLRFLTQDESWLLLQLEVFRKPECPSELQVLGKLIANQCYGLPLSIVVIGGVLAKQFSSKEDMGAMNKKWRKVSERMSTHFYEDTRRRLVKTVLLSYENLPNHLRLCFLYFGMFPEDFEIPVWKLTLMWIGEGFIQQMESMSLEETAESYLDELINMNLVRVYKRTRDGKVKTCRIHDTLHDFCINEAGRKGENLFQMERPSPGTEPSIDDIYNFRRFCLHSGVVNFLLSNPFHPRIRSFVCFSTEEISLPTENTLTIPASFNLLRVLEVKPIQFSTISDLYRMVQLRYLSISIHSAILPSFFSTFFNLQTLVVDTTSRTIEIKADIWNLMQLRHIKTNATASLPKPGKGNKGGEKLQSLGTVSPQSCTKEVFERARLLKKLSIRGGLAMLLDAKAGSSNSSMDSLRKLYNLEKLKLLNDVFPSPPSEGKLCDLPPHDKFPPNLRSLTLSDTFLDWTFMSILALLRNLEVLKLKDKAFIGKQWEVDNGGFQRLTVLLIGRTNLAVWVASAHHFPRLTHLELRNCEELKEVPIGLADIPNFQVLDLYHTPFAAKSAKLIWEVKERTANREWRTSKVNGFKLSIFPPSE